MLARLGIVEAGIVWKIRRAVYGLKESPRLWQEGRETRLFPSSPCTQHTGRVRCIPGSQERIQSYG
eukprot:9807867-Prorocentrum_lima.AAC.1